MFILNYGSAWDWVQNVLAADAVVLRIDDTKVE